MFKPRCLAWSLLNPLWPFDFWSIFKLIFLHFHGLEVTVLPTWSLEDDFCSSDLGRFCARTWSAMIPEPWGAECDGGMRRICQVYALHAICTLETACTEEINRSGHAASVGLEEESLKDRHWVIAPALDTFTQIGKEDFGYSIGRTFEVTGLAYAHDGLVLLTNDGIFAETLASSSLRVRQRSLFQLWVLWVAID